jgi:hypothetical protein
LRSLLPANVGQAVLLAPATPGSPCLLRSIAAMASATADSKQQLSFAPAGRYNQVVFPDSPALPDKSSATLFGDLVWSRYRLEPLSSGAAIVCSRYRLQLLSAGRH